LRIVHLSDIHIWRYAFNPLHLVNKRFVGIVSLAAGRARRFRLERIEEVVDRVLSLAPDHILITGDLTTTALPAEFRQAHEALAPLLTDPGRATVIPGNHDRYTAASVRVRAFEKWFGAYAPSTLYPWLRPLDHETAILGLDPTRAHLSARGLLPPDQLAKGRELTSDRSTLPRRLIIACHYPVEAPAPYLEELHHKRMVNASEVIPWLATVGKHLYCCGHVHAAWAFLPRALPNQLCVNAGAPLLHDAKGLRAPGFLQIDLEGDDVALTHHAWTGDDWSARPFSPSLGAKFFDARPEFEPRPEGSA